MSNTTTKKGQVPKKQQEQFEESYNFEEWDAIAQDFFGVNPMIMDEIKEKGFVARWINAKKFQEQGGYHRSGWRPFKRQPDENQKNDSFSFGFGTDPEGYVRRGDLVLAVKPSGLHQKHKERIYSKNRRYKEAVGQAADELRQTAKRGGLRDVQILEGYEENS